MKSVLISIKPKDCKLIANGKMTIKVLKSRPKIETPFKVYIYCTKHKPYLYRVDDDDNFELTNALRPKVDVYVKDYNEQNGKVIGEFICDKIEEFYCASVPYQRENNLGYGRFIDNGVYKVDGWHEGVVFERNDRFINSMLNNNDLKEMCLSAQEIFDYIGVGKHLYACHIFNLKIYNKPKELNQFSIPCKVTCENCRNPLYFESLCKEKGKKILTHPPYSWCYISED